MASFPVVALGASAGGLKALSTFFTAVEALGAAPGMAFVVITHLAPDEESHLAELLQHRTRLPVAEVADSTKIEVDHVYVLRPNQTLFVRRGRLEPQARSADVPPHPVDDLFRSLGVEFGPRAVAITLSGTGPNGSAGLPTVKENGGLILAQTEESCDFPDMPRNAVATGLVDAVLPPDQMIEVLLRYAEHLRTGRGLPDHELPDADDHEPAQEHGAPGAADQILETLRSHTGLDFRQYKVGLLQRRIDRRADLGQFGDWAAYADFLRRTPEEQHTLANDLLISVTSFFRDEDAWEVLRDEAIRPLVASHHPDEPFRVWVAGCASGEEAYSLGMLLFEEAKAQGKSFSIDIFATDASAKALEVARRGFYPAAAVQHLSANRMESWFEKAGDGYRIRSDLREAIVFAPQNLSQDPPFSRVRLVICRNVLIYLRPELQHKLLRLFHFALSEGGYLFLGSAENIGNADDLFETVSQRWRLYCRREATRHEILEFSVGRGSFRHRQLHTRPVSDLPPPERIAQTSLMALVERHVPPSVVVDRSLQVLFYHGAMERFLNPQSGEPTNDLASLAREGLGLRLGRLVKKTSESGNPEWERAQIALDGRMTLVSIEAAPLENAERNDLCLISFMDHGESTTADAEDERPQATHTEDLEYEVKLLREELRTTTQLSSRAREDHESSKEEIMSMNEELRSTNEELESSKEELHSLNEELNTVNTQLRENVDELKRRTDDINNLLVGTNIATLFLDTKMQIRWFSPAVQDLFNIRASDVGRPIADLVQKFADLDFSADCERVLRSLTPSEKQVRASGERSFMLRMLPYRTIDERIDGVIVTFADVTAIQDARRYAEEIVDTVPVPLLVLNQDLSVVSANPAFYETFKVAREETVNRLIYDLGNGQWNIPKLRALLATVIAGSTRFEDYEVEHDFQDIGPKAMLLSGARIDHMQLILLGIEDITERKATEAHQAILMGELSHRVKNVLGVVQGLASQTLARSTSLEDFQKTFEGRLSALSRGHSQLLEGEWQATELGHLIRNATEAFDPARVTAEGPYLTIPPQKALALNLVLHELETNAVKYGALSTPGGHIDLRWSQEDGEGTKVRLVWQELGGPPVTPPASGGFGVTLVGQLLRYEMGGNAHFSFEPDGLRCEIVFTTT